MENKENKVTVNDIIKAYTNGSYDVVKANEELARVGAGFYLDPHKHELTAEEIENGSAGLLDTGTGSLDKVKINPETMELINCDCGSMYALCTVRGVTYNVEGVKLVVM